LPSDAPLDCLVIGGGPAGLTAAVYLARFRLSVRVLDAGGGRAAMIPCTHNQAGFPDGISGAELLERMRAHARRYGAEVVAARVASLVRDGDGFRAEAPGLSLRARSVLLATGVANRHPDMPEPLHAEAVRTGRLRYCPVCDAYEVIDRSVAVIGTGARGLRESEFLRAYTSRLALVAPDGAHDLGAAECARAQARGVELLDGPVGGFALEDGGLSFETRAGRRTFDTVYPAMGSVVHSDLARALGAELGETGCVEVDAHQRTSVRSLYAAGDVVMGLDQISHAMGEAGVAATTIFNDLAVR
jgi:thioredoxin reductase (NADPH)